MKIEEKFNKRHADLIEVQSPSFQYGRHLSHGIKVQFSVAPWGEDFRTISMHLTPDEALRMAEGLIAAARNYIELT